MSNKFKEGDKVVQVLGNEIGRSGVITKTRYDKNSVLPIKVRMDGETAEIWYPKRFYEIDQKTDAIDELIESNRPTPEEPRSMGLKFRLNIGNHDFLLTHKEAKKLKTLLGSIV